MAYLQKPTNLFRGGADMQCTADAQLIMPRYFHQDARIMYLVFCRIYSAYSNHIPMLMERSHIMNIRNSVIMIIPLLLFVASVHAADEPPTPTTLPGGKVVTADEVKAMIGKASFFDMRKALSFGKGHLPGAMPLPYDQKSEKTVSFDATKDKFDVAQLPKNKGSAIVFYSDGPTGWKSYKAAVLAIRSSYTNIMWLRGGSAEWEAKGFPLEQ
jgi:rhodanese-related sulfurtransferase